MNIKMEGAYHNHIDSYNKGFIDYIDISEEEEEEEQNNNLSEETIINTEILTPISNIMRYLRTLFLKDIWKY
jgi:hypothetical protein